MGRILGAFDVVIFRQAIGERRRKIMRICDDGILRKDEIVTVWFRPADHRHVRGMTGNGARYAVFDHYALRRIDTQ
jgi:hypothetical protein